MWTFSKDQADAGHVAATSPEHHSSPGSRRQVRRPRRGLERGRGIEICAHVRKKIWAYRLFACSAAGPALQKHQKSRCSVAPSAWRGNQPCAALGTEIGAPHSITCWHVRYPRNSTHGLKRVAWHGARGCELAHIQARERHVAPMEIGRSLHKSFAPCDLGHRGLPVHCELLLCRADRYRRVSDEVRMNQPSEFNRSKVSAHRLQSVTGGVAGELMKGVLMATGGLTAMAVLVVLASFAVSALL